MKLWIVFLARFSLNSMIKYLMHSTALYYVIVQIGNLKIRERDILSRINTYSEIFVNVITNLMLNMILMGQYYIVNKPELCLAEIFTKVVLLPSNFQAQISRS